MSVLTAKEGFGLNEMLKGLVQRNDSANEAPPSLLYVDRDCCGKTHFWTILKDWPDIVIRLDVWHFMRRFSAGCTTDAHQLYSIFMACLSKSIFEWSSEDLEALKQAKRTEMMLELIPDHSEEDVVKRLTKKELSLHCRRATRIPEEITRYIQELLEAFTGKQGLDTLGTPLLDKERIWDIWESQKRHVSCLQDPEGFQLYAQTSTLLKGTVRLPTYRCARGSTSLESFHLHLKNFIPGK